MPPRFVARFLIALVLLTPFAPAASAEKPPKPVDLIGSALYSYDHASTAQFKASIVYTKVPGEIHTMVVDAKAENSPNDFKTIRSSIVLRESVVKDGTLLPTFELRTVDDGVASYIINPQAKTYQKSEHGREFCSNFFERSISRMLDAGYDFFVSRAKSGGKWVYVMTSKKRIQGLTARIIIGVEDGSFVFQRISTLREKGGEVVTDMTVTDQIFGEPLPPEVFAKPPGDFELAPEPPRPGPVVTGTHKPPHPSRKVR